MRNRVEMVTVPTGAGHRLYGQTVEQKLLEQGIGVSWYDALEDARSLFVRAYWRGVNEVYYQGSQGPKRNVIYELSRSRSNRNSPLLRPAQNEIQEALWDFGGVVVFTHAHTAVKLEKAKSVLIQGDYQGGEEYANSQVDVIVVPEEASKQELIGYGVPGDRIAVVGYLVDDLVKAPHLKDLRREQLQDDGKPHVGIYFTGAYPTLHVKTTELSLLPGLGQLLADKRIQLSIYTVTNAPLAEKFLAQARAMGLSAIRFGDDAPDGNWDVQVVSGRTTREANDRAVVVVGNRKNPISVLVTMIGERFGWAAGVALVPLAPYNRTNAGGNTKRGMELGLFRDPRETLMLPTRLRAYRHQFREQLERGEIIDANGAERITRIVQGYLSKVA